VVVATGTVLASWAAADGIDPSTPTAVVLGTPPGVAISDRLGPSRLGRSDSALPESATEVWRRELAGGLELAPVIDSKGSLTAALVSPDVVRIGRDGQQMWRTRLGSSAPVVSPVTTSDASVAVVCGDGTLWSVSSSGTVRFKTNLKMSTRQARATPLPRDDGSVVVAGDNSVVTVDGGGQITARAVLPSRPVGGLIAHQHGVLLTTENGSVYHWRPPARPRELGKLGGQLDGGAARVGPRTVVAVVDRRRVVALDLKTGSTTLLMGGDGLMQFEGPVTLDQAGVLLFTTTIGELIGLNAHGVVVRRLALDDLPVLFGADGGTAMPSIFRRLETRSSPPLIADPAGRVGFARSNGRMGVVDPSGNVLVASGRFCARPLALLPAGDGRMAIACKSGSVAMYADKSKEALPAK
jgi:hypothetical protein